MDSSERVQIYTNKKPNNAQPKADWLSSTMSLMWYSVFGTKTVHATITIQVRDVLPETCQWTQSATERFTIHYGRRGTMQVTTVYLVVDRWLFSPTLVVRQKTTNLHTGWIPLIQTKLTGSDSWNIGGRQLMEVSLSCSVNGLLMTDEFQVFRHLQIQNFCKKDVDVVTSLPSPILLSSSPNAVYHFWPRNVVKHHIRHDKVCLSVCLFVCLSLCVTLVSPV